MRKDRALIFMIFVLSAIDAGMLAARLHSIPLLVALTAVVVLLWARHAIRTAPKQRD